MKTKITFWRSKIKKSINIKCWWQHEEIETFIHCGGNALGAGTLETTLTDSYKVRLSTWARNPSPETWLGKSNMTTGSPGHGPWASAAALFSEPTDWKNPHVPPLANEKTERDMPTRWAGAGPPQGANQQQCYLVPNLRSNTQAVWRGRRAACTILEEQAWRDRCRSGVPRAGGDRLERGTRCPGAGGNAAFFPVVASQGHVQVSESTTWCPQGAWMSSCRHQTSTDRADRSHPCGHLEKESEDATRMEIQETIVWFQERHAGGNQWAEHKVVTWTSTSFVPLRNDVWDLPGGSVGLGFDPRSGNWSSCATAKRFCMWQRGSSTNTQCG